MSLFGSMGGLAGGISSLGGGSASSIGSMFGGSSSSGWGSILSGISGLFGGGGSSGGGSSNIFGQMLAGGMNGYAQAGLSAEMLNAKGRQDRTSTAFEAQLIDFYKQTDKVRKRQALDTYGQFSTIKRWAPNASPSPPVNTTPIPAIG